MKALSIQQPWAWAIIRLGKDIENRTWNTHHRGTFVVHAGQRLSKTAPDWLLKEYREAVQIGDPCTFRGGFIGTVDLINTVTKSDSLWFQGPVGFVLNNPIPSDKFIIANGKLGFFNYGGNHYDDRRA